MKRPVTLARPRIYVDKNIFQHMLRYHLNSKKNMMCRIYNIKNLETPHDEKANYNYNSASTM
jgi:hypothetical protein